METFRLQPDKVLDYLGCIPILQQLPGTSIKKIAEVVKVKHFGPGEFIVQEGEIGEGLYFIWDGEAEVIPSAETGNVGPPMPYLKPGDYFGHASLEPVKDTHKADILAKSEVMCLVLGHENANLLSPVSIWCLEREHNGIASVEQILQLESLEVDLYRAFTLPGSPTPGHVYGGQLLGQRAEEGFEHQEPMPPAPDPEELLTLESLRESYLTDARIPVEFRNRLLRKKVVPGPIDIRLCNPVDKVKPAAVEPREKLWLRARGKLSGDQALHCCVAAYASDYHFLTTALRPHLGTAGNQTRNLSLDHSIWFHRPLRADEWLLYTIESPSASNARGMVLGKMFSRTGELVLSTAQEGIMRKLDKSLMKAKSKL